jgi:hypothetical protein
MNATSQAIGPLDCFVIGMPTVDSMPFEAVREVLSLVEAEIIHVVDLVLIECGADGSHTQADIAALDVSNPLTAFAGTLTRFLTTDDLDAFAAEMAPGSCAAVFVVEHTWAITLGGTLENAHCPVIDRWPITRTSTSRNASRFRA